MEIQNSIKHFVFPCINRLVSKDSLSPYNLSLVEDGSMHWVPSKQKLIVDLNPKQNIVVHHVLLWWMLSNCFKVTKIHRAPQFDQKLYMKIFIDTFVSKRSHAKTEVQKKIYKVILN